TSALVLPALFFIMYRNKVDKKQLLYFIIPLMVPLIAVFLLKFSKLGDLYELAVYSPRIFFQNFSLVSLFEKVIMDLLFVYGKSYGILNFAAIFGVVLIFRENRNLFWILFLLIIPFTIYIFNLGLLTEDHLIITFIPMSVFSAYALFKAFFYFKKSKVLVTISILILLFSQILLSSQIFIVPEKKRSAILESTLQEFSGKFGPEAILISDWNFGMPFWYLTQNETSYSLLTGRPVRFFQKDCIDKEQCLQRLTQSFWIDIPNLRIFLAEEELKDSSFSKEREIFFVNPKSQSNWFKQLFVGKESTRDPAEPGNRKVRFINLMQKSLEMHLHIADSMDYPLEKIYKFRVMPAGR
ncbi:MAG: hypothetical protein P8Y60_17740, partial [Calditrichota bacterium]